jgi:integrase
MARLFTTSRWLRSHGGKNGHQVFIRVRMHNGFVTEIPVYDYVNYAKLPICVKKEHWNKGHIMGGKYHIPTHEVNLLLAKVERNVRDSVNELTEKNIQIKRDNIIRLTYINEENAKENERKIASGEIIVNEDGGAFASQEEFKEFIADSDDPKFDTLKKAMGIYKKEYILDFWDDFIKDCAPNSYTAPRHAIEEYINNSGDNCKAVDFSAQWLERFFKHIIENGFSFRKDGKERKPYTITTVAKYHKHLTAFGDFLFEDLKLISNQDYRRFNLKKKAKKKSLIKYNPEPYINTHALYKKEFDWFYSFTFENKQLGVVRDMFILQVWLGGLRQSDFYGISDINFHRDSTGNYKVWFEQKKTDDDVLNIVNQNYLIPILEKYPDGFKEFPAVNEYNKLLKISAEKAGLKRELKFRREFAKDKEATIEWHPIYKKICNKWARNCAVSILAELGYPDDRISKFTGHRDLEMIKHYKQIHQKEINTMMEEVRPEQVKEL